MEKIRKAEAWLMAGEAALLTLLLSVMILLSFGQVLLRQTLGIGLLWADTFLRHVVLWVGFLGAALACAQEKNFAFEAVAERCAPRTKAGLAVVAQIFTACVCALLARAAWKFLLDERAAQSPLFTAFGVDVPAWIFALIVPAGFALIGLHALLRASLCWPRLR